MTLVLDMASGEEYRGDEPGFPRTAISAPGPEGSSREPAQYVQLQLAMVETTPSRQQISVDMAGLDIEKLIQSIKD